jgi:hypothetical protein
MILTKKGFCLIITRAPQITDVWAQCPAVLLHELQKLVDVYRLPTGMFFQAGRKMKRDCSGYPPHKDTFSDTSLFMKTEKVE